MNLFSGAKPLYEPLASRMRPRRLDQFIGQDHILAPGRLLRRAIETDHLTSVLFYGPPGTGKTTLARLIAVSTKGSFLSLNAVLSGVKEIREMIEQAKDQREIHGRKTILFVDEVHRWNKAQQDALLPWVENGTFLLIGATTENPFFEVNSALVSRSRVFQLLPLDQVALMKIAQQALNDPDNGYGKFDVQWETGALDHLVEVASGDARSLLNALELAVETTVDPFPPPPGSTILVSRQRAEESIQKRVVLYDKDGDYHFDTISAFIKSLRGSDPDAALYWLAKMVRAGEDPRFLFRRMLICASEDVGLADPQALVIVQAANATFEQVGLPEGQYALAQAALYLATCPKSNSTMGYFEALKVVETECPAEVPPDLKDASRDGIALGHGQRYLYPHAFKDHWVAQRYLPAGFEGRVFYQPSEQGYEASIRSQVLERRSLFLALESADSQENLTWTSPGANPWAQRLTRHSESAIEKAIASLLANLPWHRHHRVWVASDLAGLLSRRLVELVPEGGVWVSVDSTEDLNFDAIPELLRPKVYHGGKGCIDPDWLASGVRFDRVVIWNPMNLNLSNLSRSLADRADVLKIVPRQVQRLSEYLSDDFLSSTELDLILQAEETFFAELAPTKLQDPHQMIVISDNRTLSTPQWAHWWNPDRPNGLAEHMFRQGVPRQLLEKVATWIPPSEVIWKSGWFWSLHEIREVFPEKSVETF